MAQLNASDDPLEVVEQKAKDTVRKTRTKEFIEKVRAIIDETSQRPIQQIVRDLGITLNCECMWEGGLEVQVLQVPDKPDLAREDKEHLVNQVRHVADLNPLDYFVWSYVENITNMTSHNTKASLIAAIRRVFAELPPALVKKACFQFRIRIEAVIEAEGDYTE